MILLGLQQRLLMMINCYCYVRDHEYITRSSSAKTSYWTVLTESSVVTGLPALYSGSSGQETDSSGKILYKCHYLFSFNGTLNRPWPLPSAYSWFIVLLYISSVADRALLSHSLNTRECASLKSESQLMNREKY